MLIPRLLGVFFLGLLVTGLNLGFALHPARAAGDVFTLRDIQVDVTASTAAAAREAALADGHVQAMRKLLTRVLPRDELAKIREFKAEEIISYVQDFEVTDERTSNVRYLANLTFRFKPEPVRDLLRANGLVYAETRSKPVLVLPVFGAAGDAKLWEENNLWWGAWAARPPGDWLVPLVAPLGDLGDISAIDAERTLAGDSERLAQIARRYGADDVLITQAVLLGDVEAGQAVLQVGTSRLGAQTQQTLIDNYQQQPAELLSDLLARAADAVDAEVQESWKQSNLFRPGSRLRITVVVPVTALSDWLEVKRRLRNVAAIKQSEISTLSRRQTEVDITFIGNEQQLVVAMAQSDLALALNPVSGWELRLSGAAAKAAAEAAAQAGAAAAPDPTSGQSAPASE